jgi:hypothetical protein
MINREDVTDEIEALIIDSENIILSVWATDLLLLLNGKPKGDGVRGGELLEQVENRIVSLVAAQQSVQADEATGCAHRAPRVVGVGLFVCDDCGKTLRR